MDRLIVERLIDEQMQFVEVEYPPTNNNARRYLEGRIHLLPFVRVQRDNLLPLAEALSLRNATPYYPGGALRMPSGEQLMQAILKELGAVTAGKLVQRIEKQVFRDKKLNGKQRAAQRIAMFQGRERTLTPKVERTVIQYDTIDPQELLIFFEEEDDAMLALMRYC